MYYGQPRFTNDIDLVVQLKAEHLQKFEQLFPLEDYYCPPPEVLRDEVVRNGSFNLIHQHSQIKIDVELMKPTEFYQSELARKRRVTLTQGFEANIVSPEDLIIKKLDFYREGGSEKHLVDIRGILAETEIEQSYLQQWIEKFGLAEVWKKV
jgi:hypothetical protein